MVAQDLQGARPHLGVVKEQIEGWDLTSHGRWPNDIDGPIASRHDLEPL
jgi:hypothetical protein